MSKQARRVGTIVDVGTGGVTGGLGTASGEAAASLTPTMPGMPGLPGGDPAISENMTKQVADRQQQLAAAADAAGVTRTGNDSDLLGNRGVKRQDVRRTLFGSR